MKMRIVCGLIVMSLSGTATAQYLFQDGFESGNLTNTQNGVTWAQNTNVVSTENSRTGQYSRKFFYAGGPNGSDAWAEQRFNLGAYYQEIWVKYDLYVPANYYHRTQTDSANNKGFLNLWERTYSNPAFFLGVNWWPVNDGESRGSLYIWSPDLGNLNYHDFNSWKELAIEKSDLGKWMEVLIQFRYASPSNNDGVARIWKTPQGGEKKLILDITNGKWYVPNAKGFENGYLLGYANSGFDTNTTMYIDNIVISTSPIGMNPPSAPTGFN